MPTQAAEHFGGLLKRYRGLAGLTQEQLAERAGLSTRGLQDLENGRSRAPHTATVQLLIEALALAPADRARLEAALRHQPASGEPGMVGVPSTHTPRQSGFTRPPWPLIGRAREREALASLLRRGDVRLVTLTGVGGVGKTRLALEVASDMSGSFADGALFVSLAAIRDPALVLSAIAQAVGLQEIGGRPLADMLQAYFRERQVLLLLDNLEQVAAAAPQIGALLQACPGMVVFATSRVALHLHGEQEWPLTPLPLPDPRRRQDLDALAAVPAVALFVQRAQAVQPGFTLSSANAQTVAAICRWLDGLPLALELAAARIKALPPQSLLTRLTRRLAVLGGGAVDLPDRQRTLRAAIAWSYDLLTPGEQALFRRLAVFVGGCTIESAEAVCTADDAEGEVLDRLIALVDQNLLRQEEQEDGTARFGMLETVREYGQELLDGHGEAAALRRDHALHFLALAEAAEPELVRAGQVSWARRLSAEHDNLRAALSWALEVHEVEAALRLGGSLWWFWFVRGYAIEGGRWLERVLAAAHAAPEPARDALLAKVYYGAMELAFQRADYGYGGAMVAKGFPLCRACGDHRGTVLCIAGFGFAALAGGDFAEAGRQFEAGLARAREAGDEWAGTVALYALGWLPIMAGDIDRAVEIQEECLAQRRKIGDTWGIAASLQALGLAAQAQGDHDRAASLFGEGLSHFFLLDNEQGIVDCVEGLAGSACAQGRAVTAARLFGATAAWREALGAPVWPIALAAYEQATAATQQALGKEGFARAWAEGKVMVLADAADAALRRDDWI